VDTQTRHALKQDRLIEATRTSVDWFADHRSRVIQATVAAPSKCIPQVVMFVDEIVVASVSLLSVRSTNVNVLPMTLSPCDVNSATLLS